MLNSRNFRTGIRLVGNTTLTGSVLGDLQAYTVDGQLYYNDGTGNNVVLTGTSSNIITNKKLDDSTVFFIDTSDNTKEFHFDAAGTTGTKTTLTSSQTINRVLTLPDATDTIIGRATTDTLTNKSISGSTNTITNVSLTTGVTGVLPLVNGGTGIAAASANAAFNALSPMTTGGDLIYGGASGVGTRLTNGSAGQVLTSAGTTLAPTWTTPSAGFTNPMTTAGDIIIGGSGGTPLRLAATTNGFVLTLSGGSPVWSASTGGTTSIGTINSQSKSANGLVITGSSLVAQTADASFPGMVSIGTQTFAGAKTFSTSISTPAINDNSAGLTITASSGQNLTIVTQAGGRLKFTANEGLDIEEISTPSNPAVNYSSLYFKSDHFLYSKDSNGNENLIGPGMSGTDWNNDLTFTFGPGFGTTTNVSMFYRRVGDTMEVRGIFQSGTVAASGAYIQLPGSYTINTTKLPSNTNKQQIGMWWREVNASTTIALDASSQDPLFYDGSTNNQIFFTINTTSTQFTKANGNNITGVNNEYFTVDFKVPISGWTANNGPGASGFKFFASTQVTTDSTTILSTSFTSFSNATALLTFTPTISGTYKIYSNPSIFENGVTEVGVIRIFNSSGSGTLLYESQGGIYTSASSSINACFCQSVYTLTAGVSYSFDIQGKTTAGTIQIFGSTAGNFYMFAELCG